MNTGKKKELKIYGFKSEYSSKFELIKKVLTINSIINSINGEEKILHPSLVEILTYYCLYGYNKETKEMIVDSLGLKPTNINSINYKLTKQGYLIVDKKNHQNKLLSEELKRICSYFLNPETDKQLMLVRFIDKNTF